MKNFKLLCLFLVGILFVSTVVIGGRVVEGYYGGSGGDLGMEPIFIICICIGVVVAVISCICKFLYICNGDDDKEDKISNVNDNRFATNQIIPSAPTQDSQNINMIVYDDKPPSYLEATTSKYDNISNVFDNRSATNENKIFSKLYFKNEYDQQPMRSSQTPPPPQGNSLQSPDSTNLAVTES